MQDSSSHVLRLHVSNVPNNASISPKKGVQDIQRNIQFSLLLAVNNKICKEVGPVLKQLKPVLKQLKPVFGTDRVTMNWL